MYKYVKYYKKYLHIYIYILNMYIRIKYYTIVSNTKRVIDTNKKFS